MVGILGTPEAFLRRSLQSQLTEAFMRSHLCVFHVKNLNSNPTLLVTQDTVFIVHESTCEHLTHNATQRQSKKSYTPTCSA